MVKNSKIFSNVKEITKKNAKLSVAISRLTGYFQIYQKKTCTIPKITIILGVLLFDNSEFRHMSERVPSQVSRINGANIFN